MRDVIADWFRPLSSNDGYADPVGPLELPAALREWFQLCGKRSDIWSRQDHWLPPWELRQQDDYLTIIVENQSCALWGIPLTELRNDDPPVFVKIGRWVRENSTTTEFALQMLACNIKWSDDMCWANGCGDETALELVRKAYPRFPFPDWHWPVHPTQFYGTRDLIVETNGVDDDIYFLTDASDRRPLRRGGSRAPKAVSAATQPAMVIAPPHAGQRSRGRVMVGGGNEKQAPIVVQRDGLRPWFRSQSRREGVRGVEVPTRGVGTEWSGCRNPADNRSRSCHNLSDRHIAGLPNGQACSFSARISLVGSMRVARLGASPLRGSGVVCQSCGGGNRIRRGGVRDSRADCVRVESPGQRRDSQVPP